MQGVDFAGKNSGSNPGKVAHPLLRVLLTHHDICYQLFNTQSMCRLAGTCKEAKMYLSYTFMQRIERRREPSRMRESLFPHEPGAPMKEGKRERMTNVSCGLLGASVPFPAVIRCLKFIMCRTDEVPLQR